MEGMRGPWEVRGARGAHVGARGVVVRHGVVHHGISREGTLSGKGARTRLSSLLNFYAYAFPLILVLFFPLPLGIEGVQLIKGMRTRVGYPGKGP